MSKFEKCLYKLNPNVLSRIGDDLRQGGSLVGAGITGVIIFSDSITPFEGIILIAIGLFMWIIGHLCIYAAEKIESLVQ